MSGFSHDVAVYQLSIAVAARGSGLRKPRSAAGCARHRDHTGDRLNPPGLSVPDARPESGGSAWPAQPSSPQVCPSQLRPSPARHLAPHFRWKCRYPRRLLGRGCRSRNEPRSAVAGTRAAHPEYHRWKRTGPLLALSHRRTGCSLLLGGRYACTRNI